MNQSIYNVYDYGAIGDGCAKDTQAIQNAINDCAKNGGGKVLLSAGKYLTATLFLRDNVTLHLAEGCEIIASTDHADYPKISLYERQPHHRYQFHALICADGVRNCGITGKGVINGQDKAFWTPRKKEDLLPNTVHYTGNLERPFTVIFNRCEQVHIENITISKSSVYAIWAVESAEMRFRDITFDHDFHGPNTDGIHLSSCRNVFISSCSFFVGDDCIAVDDNAATGSDGIVISDCIFESLTNAVRLYTNLDPWVDKSIPAPRGMVKNITIHNCIVKEAPTVLNIVAREGEISNIVMSGLTITQNLIGTALFFLTQKGQIRDIDISHLIAHGNGAAALMGDAAGAIQHIALSHCSFDITPLEKTWQNGFPPNIEYCYIDHHAPWTLHFRNVRGLDLDHVRVRWNSEDISAPLIWNYENVEELRENFLDSDTIK